MSYFHSNETAYLELIIGPMFSGKTSRLIELYKQCTFCDIQVAVINHMIDNRYDDSLLSSHDQVKIPCIKTDTLSKIWNWNEKSDNETKEENKTEEIQNIVSFVRESKVILINEGQFFEDLFEVVTDMLKCGKHIYICGLDGDFKRNKFGNIIDLIPLCDNVVKCTSLCSLCKNGTKGIFTIRLSHETEQIVVGNSNYIPVCRNCYETNMNENN
jgi:thymidine kinase